MQANRLEFESNNSRAGYRLTRLEVFNWGTFNQKVWRVEPRAETSLLTGANGSGKSTLVDALLTLLVPNQKRSYNQASGSHKRERDERSYVQGAFGKVRRDEGYGAKTQYLRDEGSYSVLLAQFSNGGLGQTMTLAQVLWLQNRKVEKFFVIAEQPLTIAADFANFTSIPDLKKRLTSSAQIELFDSFTPYSKSFRKAFGVRSDKALDLFNQTVKIKTIDSLNAFVRERMLERGDVQASIGDLRQHYGDLTRSYEAIQKARKQLELLTPLHDDAQRYRTLMQSAAQLRETERLVPAYFARQTQRLLAPKIEQTQTALEEVAQRFEEVTQRLDAKREEHNQVSVAIGSDEAGQQLALLEKDIEVLQNQVADKKRYAETYDALARQLEVFEYADRETFFTGKRQVEQMQRTLQERSAEASDERDELKLEESKLKPQGEALAQEIDSLRQRESQIPQRNLELRRTILDALELPEDEIPFIGERLKVKDDERAWEGAIERLLHSFGLRLLVPAQHYEAVSRYVNQTHLGGRIVFHRVQGEGADTTSYADTPPDKLMHKLEIKPGNFEGWIRRELARSYDFTCCTLEEVKFEKRALTRAGLIKGGNERFEKDDRRKLNDRTRYILGWSNEEKIAALEEERSSLIEQFSDVRRALEEVEARRRDLERQKERVQTFLQFDFAAIDWRRDDRALQDLRKQKGDLEQSSDRLKQLREQLEELAQEVRGLEADKEKTQREQLGFERDLQDFRDRQKRAEVRLAEVSLAGFETYAPRIDEVLADAPLTLETLSTRKDDVLAHLQERREEVRTQESSLTSRIVKRMQKYKSAYPEETVDVDPSTDAIDDFDVMLDKVKDDDLPRFEDEFRTLLGSKILEHIVVFQADLEGRQNDIKESIATLNESLRSIDYTPTTYIELQHSDNRDPEIRAFKTMLRACFADVGQPEASEASFGHIRALIERFETDERWTRKVTDVRNWLDFAASENYRADDTQRHYYSDSSGKSGGQKAKLAYTILASAIAYQFGLEHAHTTSKSLRFVVIDEAFDRNDERNARYAMELFKKLGLQLLVVTPENKIHIVEPYISVCHFVKNSLEENDSEVYNLSKTEFERRKQTFRDAREGRVTIR